MKQGGADFFLSGLILIPGNLVGPNFYFCLLTVDHASHILDMLFMINNYSAAK